MNRKLKALGLALFATFAISAVAASGASAESVADFNPDEDAVLIDVTGEGPQTFFVPGVGALTCQQEGEHNPPSSLHAKVDPEGVKPTATAYDIEYTNCHATFLQFPVTVDMNDCHYTLNAGTYTQALSGGTGGSDGSVTINCSTAGAGPGIDVTAFGDTETHEELICVLHLPSGQALGGVNFTNVQAEGVHAVTIELEIENELETSFEGAACGEGETSEGDYTGKALAQATDLAENYVDLTVTGT